MAELNRRHATIFVHPTVPCMACPHGELTDARPVKRFSPAIFEFFFEEARVLFSIFFSGQAQRYPNIRWIIPHGGGAVPPIVERWSRFRTEIFGGQIEMSSTEFKETLRKQFYFDLAGFVLPDLLPGLLRFVDPSRMLYGSDYPDTPESTAVQLAGEMDRDLRVVVANKEDRAAIYHGNAEELLARNRV